MNKRIHIEIYSTWQQCGAHLIDVNRTFRASNKADDQRVRELQQTDRQHGVVSPCSICVCVCVQLNPVTRTALIQMNSTRWANLKSIC